MKSRLERRARQKPDRAGSQPPESPAARECDSSIRLGSTPVIPPPPGSTVFVVDDDPDVRASIADLLASAGFCCEAFGSSEEFFQRRSVDAPSCVVLDLHLPGMDGLAAQRALVEAGITSPIIFVTGFGDIPTTVQAMKAGAVEFLTKPFDDQALLDAISSALARDQVTRELQRELSSLRARYTRLTPRERQVMALVVSGRLNKQIAAELGTSEITVKIHRHRLMTKMQAQSVAHLVRMAGTLERSAAGAPDFRGHTKR